MKKIFYILLFLIASITQTILAQDVPVKKKDTLGLEEVTILGKRKKQFRSTAKLDVSLKDMPITLNVVSSQLLKQQEADDMVTALRNVSGVRPVSTYGGFQHYIIRGFQDFVLLIDGFRDERHNISTSAPTSNLANVERIEVLKGPASVLYGHSALGGVINIIRKKTSTTPQYDFSVGYGSFNTRRTTVGAGGSITKKLTYRTDFGMSEDTGWRKAGGSRSTGYLSLDYNPTEKDQLNVQIGVSKDHYNNDAGIPIDPLTNKIPRGVALSNRYNVPQDFLNFNRVDLQVKYARQINSKIQLSNNMGYAIDDIDYLSTESLTLNAAKDSVQRGYFDFNHKTKPFQNVLDFSFNVKKWNVDQKIVAGYSLNLLDRHTFWDSTLRSKMASTVSVINPQENQGPVARANDMVRNISEVMHGLYLQDFITFSPKIKALIGARYDIFDGSYSTDKLATATTPEAKGLETDRKSHALTYRLGFVYQPTKSLSAYSSYSTYFKPARQIPTSGTLTLEPETGNQYELGLRYDVNDKISINTAGYSILKNDMIVGLGGGKFDQASAATSKGFEADVTGQWFKGFQTVAGYAYTDARFKDYTSSVVGAGNLTGKTLQYVAKNQFNLWATYEIQGGNLKGLAIGAGGYYLGDNFANSKNTVVLPEYQVLNTSLSYSVKTIRINFLVNNVFNKTYFSSAINGSQLYPGAPRNCMMSFSCKF